MEVGVMKRIIWILLCVSGVVVQASGSSSAQEQATDCSICMGVDESCGVTVTLNCNHCFGNACIKEWLYEHTTCPLCRTLVTTINGENVTVPLRPTQASFHEFNFEPNFEDESIVAPQYHQQVIKFVQGLSNEEYEALMETYSDTVDNLEETLSLTPEWVDDTWLSLEHRKEIFRAAMRLIDGQPRIYPLPDEAERLRRMDERIRANFVAFKMLNIDADEDN